MKQSRNAKITLVSFRIDDRTFAIPLESVTRVEQAVAVTPVPGAPPHLMGVINHRGRILPVVNLRIRLGLPQRAIEVNDQLMLVSCHMGIIVLPVDQVQGIIESRSSSSANQLFDNSPEIDNIIATGSGITMITNPDHLLKPKETLELYELAQELTENSTIYVAQ